MKQISLTRGAFTIIDDEDFEFLNQQNWHLHKSGYACLDGNKLNNRKSNLRICTHMQNMGNQRIKNTNTSGYKGVYWNKQRNRWQAYIHYNYKSIYLGLYNNIHEAANAYNGAALQYFGEFAHLNKIIRKDTKHA